VVAGGGPAGAVAALAVASAGHPVVVLDAGDPPARAGETLPPAGLAILRDLGLAEPLRGQGHLPSAGNRSAWGSSVLSATDAIRDPHGTGWQLDRRRFDALLRDAARAAGAQVLAGARLRGLESSGKNGWRVTLSDGRDVCCSWLIDATGRRRSVARRCGGQPVRLDRLVAVQALLTRQESAIAADQDTRTLVEAARDGWWYTSRAPTGGRVVAFLTDADLAGPAAIRSLAGFRQHLARTEHVRQVIDCGYALRQRPRGGDASSTRLDRVGGAGWIAVGDAALSFDPLSSQGIFNALYTGLTGGQAVSDALAGAATGLADYADRITAIYTAYLGHRAAYYQLEGRWAGEPFWRRRILGG